MQTASLWPAQSTRPLATVLAHTDAAGGQLAALLADLGFRATVRTKETVGHLDERPHLLCADLRYVPSSWSHFAVDYLEMLGDDIPTVAVLLKPDAEIVSAAWRMGIRLIRAPISTGNVRRAIVDALRAPAKLVRPAAGPKA